MKKFWITIAVVAVLVAAAIGFITYICKDDWCYVFPWQKTMAVDSFERCANLGFPVMESYPRQCRAGGKTFVEKVAPIQPPIEEPAPTTEFNKPITIQVGEKITFSDGLELKLKEINDSRCKPGVVCIWQGELAPILSLVHGNIGETAQEIRLGTVMNKSISTKGYIFTLQSAAEQNAVILVNIVKIE